MPLGLAALDDLFDAFETLRGALSGNDPHAIEAAASRVSGAVSAVRAIGAWRADPEVADRVKALMPLLESARIRINLLSDHVSQRLAILADHGAQSAPLTYGR